MYIFHIYPKLIKPIEKDLHSGKFHLLKIMYHTFLGKENFSDKTTKGPYARRSFFISFYLLLRLFFFSWTLLSNCKFPRLSSRRHRVCILNVFSREKTNFIGFLNNWNFSPIFNYHVIWKKRERKRKVEEKRDCLKHLNDLIFQFTLISFFFFSLFPFRKLKRINLFTGVKVCSMDVDSLVELAWSKQILLIEK